MSEEKVVYKIKEELIVNNNMDIEKKMKIIMIN
jgi:hypothetical protein